MADESVGFEAYFETEEFLRGVDKFFEAIDKLTKSIDSLDATISGLSKNAIKYFNALTDSASQMANELEVSLKKAGMDTTLTGITDKAAKEAGKKAGLTLSDMLLTSFTADIKKGSGLKEMISNIGAVLGMVLGTSVGGPAGGAIGANIGASLFSGIIPMAYTIGGAFIGALVGSVVPGLGTTLGVIIGGAIFGITGKLIQSFFDTIVNALKGAIGLVVGIAWSIIQPLANALGDAFQKAFEFAGEIAKKAMSTIVSEIEDMWGKATQLQRLDVGMEALVRSALVAEGSFKTASDAMEAAIPIARDLREVLRDMTLGSPYLFEDVYNIFRTNAAMGISLETALMLTDATMELGAATSFTDAVLKRIARNFAQVAIEGAIYRRDSYQLAQAGINVAEILEEELGTSLKDINKQLEEGTISVNDLMDAFVTFSKKRYGGSAEALAATLDGVKTKFENLKSFIAQDIFSPVLTEISAKMTLISEAFRMLLRTDVFKFIGDQLALFLNNVLGNVDWSIDSLALMIVKFMNWVVTNATEFFRWGQETMFVWIDGMIKGIAQGITALIRFINSVFTSLFSPHSPPRILPLIDQWGAGTIQAWLEGMTKADFSVIGQIITPIERALSQLGFESPKILARLQSIVAGISTGGIDSGIINFIKNITGPYGDAIAKLVKEEHALALAIQEVELAQKRLNEATKAYEDADKTVQKLVREYNALLRAGADDGVLDTKLAEIRAMQGQRKTAAELVNQAEAQLEVAEENKKEADETVKTQRELVDMMLRLTNITKKETKELKGLSGKLKEIEEDLEDVEGIAKGIGNIRMQLSGFEIPAEVKAEIVYLKDNIIKLREEAEGFIDGIKDLFTPETQEALSDIVESFGDLKQTFEDIGGLTGVLGMVSLKVQELWLELQIAAYKAEQTAIWLGLIALWLISPVAAVGLIPSAIKKTGELGDKSEEAKGNLEDIRKEIEDQIQETYPGLIDSIDDVLPSYDDTITKQGEVGESLATLDKNTGSFSEEWAAKWGDIVDVSEAKTSGISISLEDIASAFTALDEDTGGFKDAWAENWKSMADEAKEKRTDIDGNISGISSSFGGVKDKIGEVIEKIADFSAALLNLVLPAWLQRDSPSPIEQALMGMREYINDISNTSIPRLATQLRGLKSVDLTNHQPSPTSSYIPSSIRNTAVTNTYNMGGNVVRSDTDLAAIDTMIKKNLRIATFGV